MIIGLTGGIGTGKSTVANFFAKFPNIVIYTADIEAKKLMNSSKIIQEKIINEFGIDSFLNDVLQRDYLAKIVFNNPEKLSKLNLIVHPEVKKHFQDFVKKNTNKLFIIYENAILFESKSNLFCDVIITVFSRLETRIQRVMKRDNVTKQDVFDRIKNQLSEESKLLQSHYIILNEDLDNTQNQVKNIYKILTKK
ncbi:MAG: dephospho-CoA kinase [Flavobacteriia bacterium]|nr:dephospho-CoA kinase [Flavobacteriia bacterium]OIP48214.1 MAG: dephospho-CoA kinase [Flavobacteriaceae bacterium CG2_30_31_66]PIV96667.1 MAG: dephospho-CoA kinase [Flavobacteriaceae bacterium CG17_big_fil_post_rev_8_21_14_2_50_31_13]PIX13780.1 MAG: dephospho-CoA kinase [Flavobacteriaceae bacterium CG_4_8_14_3_um_filter_31_8]PIY14425.1 MAG: dephospho-CoA kinase [Flavobacteriaceae bacterium CG_4_10_14_3_um_filter_31_253]PIZ10012.1 MAG: dephospho-CoA kinase [Flavobacteriaceae bacterium CG_4_10